MKYLLLCFMAFSIYTVSTAQRKSKTICLTDGSSPSFSHNGKMLAFSKYNHITLLNLQTKRERVVSSLFSCNPKFSPNDKQLVFQSYGNDTHYSIWVVDADGKNPHKFIKESPDGDQYPSWSPDGKKIAWTHGKEIWIADANGTNAKPLTKNRANQFEYVTDWSADSKTILFLRSDTIGYRMCTTDSSGLNFKQLTPIKHLSYAKFGEKDSSIYYTTYSNQLYTYHINSRLSVDTNIRIENVDEISQFDLSPDFCSLTYDNSGPDTDPNIYILKIKQQPLVQTQKKRDN